MNILEGIQNQCLRICLSARADTTVSTLQHEAQCPPIADIMQLGIIKFLLKMKDRDKQNPLLTILMNQICRKPADNNYLSWGAVVGTILRRHEVPFEYQAEDLNYKIAPWKESSVAFDLTEMPCAKASMSDEQCEIIKDDVNREIEAELRDPGTAIVACDASIANGSVSYAAILRYMSGDNLLEYKTGARLNCVVGSMTAELAGIRDSLSLLLFFKKKNTNCPIERAIIYTDSLSAWSNLKSGKIADNFKVIDDVQILMNKVSSNGISITVCWVPSHIGIHLNSKADNFANMMHFHIEAPLLSIQPSVSIRMRAAQRRAQAYRLQYDKRENKHQFDRYLRINPNLEPPVKDHGTRDIEILIQNLRLSYLDTCLFHHRVVLCSRCKEPFSTTHYLVDCGSTPKLAEASVRLVAGGTGSMGDDAAAEKILFTLGSFTKGSNDQLTQRINALYEELRNYPVAAECMHGHPVIKNYLKFIR